MISIENILREMWENTKMAEFNQMTIEEFADLQEKVDEKVMELLQLMEVYKEQSGNLPRIEFDLLETLQSFKYEYIK